MFAKAPRMRRWQTKGAKKRDVAFVDLSGKRVYLGAWGSDDAQRRYEEAIAAWRCQLSLPKRPSIGIMSKLCDAYVEWATEHYVKGDRATTTGAKARIVAELLYRAGLGRLPVGEFGPLALEQFQVWLASGVGDHGRQLWSRGTINEYVRVAVDMIRWAVSKEHTTAEHLASLRTVRGLAKGRAPAKGVKPCREGRIVMPAPRESILAIRHIVPPPVRAMIDLQLLTGMRPAEVCAMSPHLVRETSHASVLVYLVPPERNKTDHFSIERQVWLGPRSVRILKLFWPNRSADAFFSPARAESARNAARRAARATKAWASHQPEVRRRRRGQAKAQHGDTYSTDSYRRSIERACDAAGVPRFTPNQLRHSAATSMALRNELEIAQLMLGHTDRRTTMRYAKEAARKKAQRAAARIA